MVLKVVPGSQFTVSRTARKDNTSDYYLDGKKQTFKEIGIVLRCCGIDLDHNRFLILQVFKINNTRKINTIYIILQGKCLYLMMVIIDVLK